MKNASRTVVSSAELPVYVVDSLRAAAPLARPRVEVVFDAHTRLILGFRVADGERVPTVRRRGPRRTG